MSKHQADIVRPLANFSASLWDDDHFANSFCLDSRLVEKYRKEVEELKEAVRRMLVAPAADEGKAREKMNLIDTIERRGISYHFDKEIEEQLETLYFAYYNAPAAAAAAAGDKEDGDGDLSSVSIHFRVFRQHGYNISCDMFQKFMNNDGKFKESLTEDVMGMLNLYEAAYLRVHGEDILEEAVAFTTTQLESSMGSNNTRPALLAKQVRHALEQTLHRGIPRIEARYYISIYEEDESKNEVLLRLAKLDFNLVQMLHRQELSELTRWWKDLGFTSSKLAYIRHRLVELYSWALGTYFQPCYTLGRIIFTKIGIMTSALDDTYDAYGVLEELVPFTDAIQRWDMSAIDELPDYMKKLYSSLLELYEDLDQELSKQGRSYGLYYSIESFKELTKSYLMEAKWCSEGYVARFDEYMANGLVTSAYFLFPVASILGIVEEEEAAAAQDDFEWLHGRPKMVVATSVIARLTNDIKSHHEEKERGHVATAVECYMKEYGVSEEEATKELYKMIEDGWKDLNEEHLKLLRTVKRPVLMRTILNLTRVLDWVYKHCDGYTHSDSEVGMKAQIISLLMNPIPI